MLPPKVLAREEVGLQTFKKDLVGEHVGDDDGDDVGDDEYDDDSEVGDDDGDDDDPFQENFFKIVQTPMERSRDAKELSESLSDPGR